MFKRLLLIMSAMALFSGSLFGQEAAPAPEKTEPGFSFAFGFSLGYSAFSETETYQKLSLKPDFGFGKFGFGLGIDLNYRFVAGVLEVRKEDWVPDAEHNIFDLYLPMFRYIRYGKKGEPLYVKIGAVEDMSLGNGFIMNYYANTLFLPKTRITGIEFDLDGQLFGFPLLGFETVVGNLSAFDVMGARFYVRPLVFMQDLPILPNLQIGVTYVVDRDPFKYVYDGWATAQGVTDEYTAYADAFGVDFRQPILTEAPVTFAVYGDFVWEHKGKSTGGMVGLGGTLIEIFTYNMQLRFVGDNFVPVYFDATYDVTRAVRYPLIEIGTSPGYIGWFASLGTEIGGLFVFRIDVDGPFGSVDPANPDNYLNYPHLRGVLSLKEGPLAGFSADLVYDKTLLGKSGNFFGDLVDPTGAVTTAKLNYRFGPAIISLLYEIRYVPDAAGDPWQITSGLESSVVIPF